MFKTIFLAVVLFFSSFGTSAQTSNQSYTKWEKYKFPEHNFSILLPKLPVVVKTNNLEISEQREEFAAYSNGVAYVVACAFELRDKQLNKASEALSVPFSEENYARRLSEIKHRYRALNLVETPVSRNNLKGTEFSNGEWTFQVFFDPNQKSWYELWAVTRGKRTPEINKFFDSFKLESAANGKTVGNGAPAVLGDFVTIKYTLPDEEPKETGLSVPGAPNRRQNVFQSVRIVLMPSPKYTDEARKANTHGTVRLRVTFANSGNVTDIQTVDGLPNGLTEQAIATVKKLLFIPAVSNKEFVSTAQIIEYNFSAY